MLYQLSYSRLISSKGTCKMPDSEALQYPFCSRVGRAGFEPTKASASRFTVCPSWPLWYLPILMQYFSLRHTHTNPSGADEGIRTPDLQITNQLLWPTELHRQFKEPPVRAYYTLKKRWANVWIYILLFKINMNIFEPAWAIPLSSSVCAW